MPKIICQFSCGAASAVATKLTLAEHDRENVMIVNAFIEEEHRDNRRFLADCEKWFDHPIVQFRDEKYSASTHEVWRRSRFMKGPHGAPCSLKLKRELLNSVAKPGDISVIGFTREESDRAYELEMYFGEENFAFPLIDRDLSHDDCLAIVERAGIKLPMMYRMGYANASCIGCPKGGQNYWQRIRRDFPQQFVQIQEIQENIGPGAYFLRHRSGARAGERMSLAELPPGDGNLADEPSFSCSFFCAMAEREIEMGSA